MAKAKTKGKIGKSKYAQKIEYRRRLSGSKHYESTNRGQTKRLPLPLPLFTDV